MKFDVNFFYVNAHIFPSDLVIFCWSITLFLLVYTLKDYKRNNKILNIKNKITLLCAFIIFIYSLFLYITPFITKAQLL